MLTALSVARDCGMIERKDKVILAMVTPPIGTQPPSVEWTYAEDAKRNVTEIQTIRQVGDSLIQTIRQVGDSLIQGIRQVGDSLIQGIRQVGDSLIQGIRQMGDSLIQGIRQVGDSLIQGIRQVGDSLIQGIRQVKHFVTTTMRPIVLIVLIVLHGVPELWLRFLVLLGSSMLVLKAAVDDGMKVV